MFHKVMQQQQHLYGMVGYTVCILYKILFRVYQWKNLENRSIFREVVDMSHSVVQRTNTKINS